jgi:hypothetical protein
MLTQTGIQRAGTPPTEPKPGPLPTEPLPDQPPLPQPDPTQPQPVPPVPPPPDPVDPEPAPQPVSADSGYRTQSAWPAR